MRTENSLHHVLTARKPRRRGTMLRALGVAAAALVAGATAAPAANANLLSSFEVEASSTQAGAYADVRTAFTVADVENNPLRTMKFRLPVGFLGTISNFETCPLELYALPSHIAACPEDSIVGEATVTINANGPGLPPVGVPLASEIVVLRASRSEAALLGVRVEMMRARALISLVTRPDDYGLEATVRSMPNTVMMSDMTLWGVPWDNWSPATQARTKRLPFVANPARCGDEDETSVQVESYANPGVWETYSDTTPPQVGCDKLEFKPRIWARPDTPFTSSPSGLAFGIDVPQNNDPDQLAVAPIKNVSVTLPEGMSINPSVANGLEACTDAQLGKGSNDPSQCPPASRIGTAEFVVPALRDPKVEGRVYIGQPLPGNTYRLFLEGYGTGVRVKLVGTVKPDPRTGQITAYFPDNPQAPVESIRLDLKGGPRAALAMPDTCGRKEARATIDSWTGQAKHTHNLLTAFDIAFNPQGAPCPPQAFTPAFNAGVQNPSAAASSPFALHVAKADGQADITGVNLKMPKGLLANLKGNLGSRIGTATVKAGVGSQPYSLSGPVVLEGAYGDAPFSLRVTVPVIAGPFNLGDVVVRQKLYVDPDTAEVTVSSDPLPTIWEGIPVKLQDIQVRIDKAGFMVNPTSCDVQQIKGGLSAVTGQVVSPQVRFQVGDCAALKYAPKLQMAVSGPAKELKNGGHPRLDATLTTKPGEANQRKAQVTLPLNLALDPENAKALCEPSQVPTNSCPQDSIVGTAKAVSILDVPLEGPVYFVRGERTTAQGRVVPTLPKLFIPLKGQGVTVNLHASSDVKDRKLQTTFENLPDAPIERFELSINGGSNGILKVTNGDVCKTTTTPKVGQRFTGQNGKVFRSNVTLETGCRFGIARKVRNGNRITITTVGLTGGRVTVSGQGIESNRRTISSRSSVASVGVSLTAASRRALREGKTLRLRVKASFKPSKKGAKSVSKTTSVVVKPAKK